MERTNQELEQRIRDLELQVANLIANPSQMPLSNKGTIYAFRNKKIGTIDFVGMFQGPKELISNRRQTHLSDSLSGYRNKVPFYCLVLMQALYFDYDQIVVEEITYSNISELRARETFWQKHYLSIQSAKSQTCFKCGKHTT